MSLRPIVAVLALCTAALLAPAWAEPVFPPGLRVGLEPAQGLVPSRRFPGFEDTDRGAMVTVVDLPGAAYAELEKSAIAGSKRETFAFAGGTGLLFSSTASDNGVAVRRWQLLARPSGGPTPDLTLLINVQVPEAAASAYSDATVRKMLASVTLRAPPLQEQVGLLPFTIDDMAGFRPAQAIPTGLILTDNPSAIVDNNHPYMVVTLGRGDPMSANDRGRFVNDLLVSLPLRDVSVLLSEPQRIGGRPGYETRVKGVGPAGNEVRLVQWVRFNGGSFLRVVGVARPEQWDALFPRFRQVRDAIDLK